MHALKDFLTTDYGLLSAGVIAFTIAMGGYYVSYFLKHIKADIAAEDARRKAAAAAK